MSKHLITAVLTLFFLDLQAQHIVSCTGFASPESVLQSGEKVWVSNVGEKPEPTSKDGDGFISLLTKDGKLVEKRFLPLPQDTLHAPKGMVLVGNTLFVTDIDKVNGFDVVSRKMVFEVSLQGQTAFLNDLVAINPNELIASATDRGKLFRILVKQQPGFEPIELPITLAGANGLLYDAKTQELFVNGFGENNKPNGKLWKVLLKPRPVVEKVNAREGFYDGLATYKNSFLVSDWVAFEKKGILLEVNKKSGTVKTYRMPYTLAGPADICVNEKTSVLWVPAMLENKVYRINLKGPYQAARLRNVKSTQSGKAAASANASL